MRRGQRKLYTEDRGTPKRDPMSNQSYSVRPCDKKKERGLQQRYMFRKGKRAVDGNPKKNFSGIKTETGVEYE